VKQEQIDRVETEVIQAENLVNSFELKLDSFHNQFRAAVPGAEWESLVSELDYIRQKLLAIRGDVARLRHEIGR